MVWCSMSHVCYLLDIPPCATELLVLLRQRVVFGCHTYRHTRMHARTHARTHANTITSLYFAILFLSLFFSGRHILRSGRTVHSPASGSALVACCAYLLHLLPFWCARALCVVLKCRLFTSFFSKVSFLHFANNSLFGRHGLYTGLD